MPLQTRTRYSTVSRVAISISSSLLMLFFASSSATCFANYTQGGVSFVLMRISSLASLILACLVDSKASALTARRRVLVTGAGGQTGSRVLKLLESKPDFEAVGLVRTQESKASLPSTSEVVVGSITDVAALKQCMTGCDALIICTSATPRPSGETSAEGRPIFGFPNGQPEEVDWLGQKNQIDAAKGADVKHVVICGSMGGTNPDNMLNSIGKGGDGSSGAASSSSGGAHPSRQRSGGPRAARVHCLHPVW